MAVLKYRDQDGNWTPTAAVNVAGGGNAANVVLPNMYHVCEDNWPNTSIEYNVADFNTLSFDYYVTQNSITDRTKSAVTITAYLGGHYIAESTDITMNSGTKTVYILNRFTKDTSSTYTLDVADYQTMILSISSTNPDLNAYVREAGYVIVRNFVPA